MSHVSILWIATLVYALHVVEEFIFDWRGWATAVMKLPVTWGSFAAVNGAVVVLGISCASVGRAMPEYALALPALMLINATLFHVLPFLAGRAKRFSPGLFTAVLLFYPVSVWAYWGASRDGVLSWRCALASLLLGATLMAFPVALLKLSALPYFRQSSPD